LNKPEKGTGLVWLTVAVCVLYLGAGIGTLIAVIVTKFF